MGSHDPPTWSSRCRSRLRLGPTPVALKARLRDRPQIGLRRHVGSRAREASARARVTPCGARSGTGPLVAGPPSTGPAAWSCRGASQPALRRVWPCALRRPPRLAAVWAVRGAFQETPAVPSVGADVREVQLAAPTRRDAATQLLRSWLPPGRRRSGCFRPPPAFFHSLPPAPFAFPRPSPRPSLRPSRFQPVRPSTRPPVRPPARPPACPPARPSARPSACPSACPSARLSDANCMTAHKSSCTRRERHLSYAHNPPRSSVRKRRPPSGPADSTPVQQPPSRRLGCRGL